MTQAYEALQARPQVGIDVGALTYGERGDIRRLKVTGSSGRTAAVPADRFQTVYYLAGDEEAAAERFAEANAEAIADLDLSARNVLQSSLDRELYDRVLDAAGRRSITRYETVVLERREDGTAWLVDRDCYDTRVDRRYTTSEGTSARVSADVSLDDVYDEFGPVITQSDLTATAIEGDVRQVLDYYRVAAEFDCVPTTDDGELAVRVRTREER